LDRGKQQLYADGDIAYPDKSVFNPPSDEDEQGEFASKEHKSEFHKRKMEDKAAQAAQQAMHLGHTCMLADHDKGFKEQMDEQSWKRAAELETLRQSQRATQNIVAKKATPQVHDYKVAAHFESMTKANDTLFDRKPENWPTFLSNDILNFEVMGEDINFLESYFDIPENIVSALGNYLKNTKTDDICWIDTKLYKLNALKTKLRNYLAPAFGNDIEESLPEVTIKKYGRMYSILIISHFWKKNHANTLFGITSYN
jgi:hypothetical protein